MDAGMAREVSDGERGVEQTGCVRSADGRGKRERQHAACEASAAKLPRREHPRHTASQPQRQPSSACTTLQHHHQHAEQEETEMVVDKHQEVLVEEDEVVVVEDEDEVMVVEEREEKGSGAER